MKYLILDFRGANGAATPQGCFVLIQVGWGRLRIRPQSTVAYSIWVGEMIRSRLPSFTR